MDNKEPKVEKHHHHVLSDKAALSVGVVLLALTAITVAVARIDLGPLNFIAAFLVASIKGTLVALFFMNLKYDRKENAVIFGTSFVFVAIFIVLTATDVFFRGNVAVKGAFFAQAQTTGGTPWVSTPEAVARGKELFAQQCVACHGPEGKGNGPAAAALKPPPRDFTSTSGWKNGWKPSQILKTLNEGIPASPMPPFASLPIDDRWALAHFVAQLNPQPQKDTPEDLKKVGAGEGAPAAAPAPKASPSVAVDVVMENMAQPEFKPAAARKAVDTSATSTGGGKLYAARCAECHGNAGEGAQVRNMGVFPKAFLVAKPFGARTPALLSLNSFRTVVVQGIPGQVMPGSGDLSAVEIEELYRFIRDLAADR